MKKDEKLHTVTENQMQKAALIYSKGISMDVIVTIKYMPGLNGNAL